MTYFYEAGLDLYTQYYYDNAGNKHNYAGNAGRETIWSVKRTNGELRLSNQVKCGELNGVSLFRNELGDSSEVRSYLDDELHGIVLSFYHHGILKSKEWYSQGKLDSISTDYYPNGKVESVGYYKNGLRSGQWKFYHDNGKLDAVMDYNVLGQRHGWSTYYDYTGEIMLEKHYSSGTVDSFRYLGRDNKMLPAIYVDADSAVIISYYSNGKLAARENYIGGSFHGEIIRYHADGSVMESYNLIYGDYHGPFYYGYPGGLPRLTGNYLNDSWHGPIIRYSAPGKIFSEVNMESGLPFGKAVYYNLKGVKTHEHNVRDYDLVEAQ